MSGQIGSPEADDGKRLQGAPGAPLIGIKESIAALMSGPATALSRQPLTWTGFWAADWRMGPKECASMVDGCRLRMKSGELSRDQERGETN